jgi:hypothetical protein
MALLQNAVADGYGLNECPGLRLRGVGLLQNAVADGSGLNYAQG